MSLSLQLLHFCLHSFAGKAGVLAVYVMGYLTSVMVVILEVSMILCSNVTRALQWGYYAGDRQKCLYHFEIRSLIALHLDGVS